MCIEKNINIKFSADVNTYLNWDSMNSLQIYQKLQFLGSIKIFEKKNVKSWENNLYCRSIF